MPAASELLARNTSQLLKARGWNRNDIARVADVDTKTIYNLLMKKNSPTLDVVDRLAAAFGLSASILLSESVTESIGAIWPKLNNEEREMLTKPAQMLART